jgi:Tol biopolymer transport system component
MIFPKFMVDAPTPTNIFVANINAGGGELQLTTDGRSHYPVWSPDGKRIAYIHFGKRTGPNKEPITTTEIVLMDADGKNQERFASFQFGREPTLSWSPDGKTLAIGGIILGPSDDGSGFVESSIYLLNTLSRKSPQLLVKRGFSPSWSPDGSQIAYTCTTEVRSGEYKGAICVIPVVGNSKPRLLVENASKPIWSPNGENIAYLSRVGMKRQLVMCRADGSNMIALTDGKRDVQSVAWSPDGRQIAFTEEFPMEDEVIQSGPLHWADVPCVFVMRLDGTRIGPFGEEKRLWCHDLSWSSEGTFIAAICTSGLRDKATRKQRFEASLFLLDSANPNALPHLIAQNGVERAVFSPR